MSQRCDVCAIEAAEGQNFIRETTFFSKAKVFCPTCHARLNQRVLGLLIPLYLLIGLIGAVLCFSSSDSFLGKGFLELFLLQLFVVTAIVPHELGHALVGRGLGFHISKVIIGQGVPVFHFRFLRFPFEIRRVPFGGLTVVSPPNGQKSPRRWFVFIVAGPLVNFVLAGTVYWIFKPDIHSFSAKQLIQPAAALFVIANAIVVIENLFPYQIPSAYGPIGSDGLQLLQLLFGQIGQQRSDKFINFGGLTMKVVATIFLLFCACLFFGIGWVLLSVASRENVITIVLLEILMGLFGATLIFFVYRGWKGKRKGHNSTQTFSGSPVGLSPYAQLHASYTADMQRAAPSEISVSLLMEIGALSLRHDWIQLSEKLPPIIAVAQGHFGLEVLYGFALKGTGNHRDAAARLLRLAKRTDVSSASAAVVQAEALRCLVIDGQFDEARRSCEAFIMTRTVFLEKIYLLDCAACFAHTEGKPEYLPEADRWSQMALELAPKILTVQATRGAVLTDLGRYSEAQPLLEGVYKQSDAGNDQGICALFLAICAKAVGDLNKAEDYARRASVINPEPWIIKRLETEGLVQPSQK